MARKQSGISTAHSPPGTDNFSLIKGIGPILSQRLRKSGIHTYSQLASFSPVELAEKVSGLSVKQIVRQAWIRQAYKLANRKTCSKPTTKGITKHTIRQHYENFTIEFLLDEKKIVHHIRVLHVQSGNTNAWAGWETDQLIDFLVLHAGVQIPAKEVRQLETSKFLEQSTKNSSSGPGIAKVNPTESPSLSSSAHEASRPNAESAKTILPRSIGRNLTGILCLQNIKVLPIDSETPLLSLQQNQAYRIQITLDLTGVSVCNNAPLQYQTTINFKQMGGAYFLVAEISNNIQLSDRVTLDIPCTNPPPGLYRPIAIVKFFSGKMAIELIASLKGDLIQVF